MNKKVSVIIPCFNSTKFLPKCFVSLAEQTIGIDNMELIFVNDASTDGGATWEMLGEFEKAYPESVIIIDLPENRRQGGARNEGLLYSSGEYISFIDADDYVYADMYEKAYKTAKENDADIVQFNHDWDIDGKIIHNQVKMAEGVYIINNAKERKEMLISERLNYGCCSKIYKRELIILANTRFAEHVVYEEPLFVYPLLFYGNRFVIIQDYLYMYRKNSVGTVWNEMKRFDTLLAHADVQLLVWKFMKKTEFFHEYYEEIKLYFLHTYLYETLYFAKKRGIEIDYKEYKALTDTALTEVTDIEVSKYEEIIAKQIKLYRLIKAGLTEGEFLDYMAEFEL